MIRPSSAPSTSEVVPLSTTDPVLRHLSDRVGGPAGDHLRSPDSAGRRGSSFWSIARILTALTVVGILLAALSGQYCRINGWGGASVYHWGCYSDVSALWGTRDLNESAWAPFSEHYATFEYPVLTMLLVSLIAAVTHGLTGMTDGYWEDRSALLFWDITFLAAALVWIVLVLATMKAAGRRPWDAAIIALSPAIIFGIGINWDIWPVAALALAILFYQRQQWVLAGVLIGIGTSFKLYPLFMLGAVVVLALRTVLRKENDDVDLYVFLKVAASAVISWLVLNVPVMLINVEAWAQFFIFSSERGAGYSSIWHAWMVLGETGPSAETVSTLSFLLFAASCVGVLVIGLTAEQRPRMVQLLFLIVAAFVIFNKVYSPQFMMWLVPLIVLAAPRLRDLLIWHFFQLLHYWAIWMYLADLVGDQETQHSFDTNLYVLAVAGHLASTIYVMIQVIWDIYHPERDVVRGGPAGTLQHF